MPRKAIGKRPQTGAEKQAIRRGKYRLMREAWDEVREVKTAERAHEIAKRVIAAVDGVKPDAKS